jgi:glycosyltransferase involved in cell wall biosynthesis
MKEDIKTVVQNEVVETVETPKHSIQVEETFAYQYYKDQLKKYGIKTYESEDTDTSGKAERIVLVQTQGYVPVKPYVQGESDLNERDRGWVRGGLTDTGGQTFYVLETALAFARMGRHVTILAQRFDDDPVVVNWAPGVDIVRISPAGIASSEDEFPFVRKEDLYFTLDKMSIDAIAVAKLVGAQGIVGNYADGGVVALNIAKDLDIPMIFIAHSLGYTKMTRFGFKPDKAESFFANPTDEVRSLNFKERMDAEIEVIHGTNYIVSNSPEEKSVFENGYGITVTNHEVLPAGVAQSFYDAYETKPSDELAESYGLTPNKYFLGWGRIAQMKNVPAQVEILAELRKLEPGKYDDVKVVIVGGNPESPEGEEEIAVAKDMEEVLNKTGLKLGKDVVRIASLSHDKIAALASYSLGYLGTQTFEPFGMAAAESMAAGVGITAVSDRAGIANWIEDNVSGVLIDPVNANSAANKINAVLKDDVKFKNIVSEGVKVAAQFTWDAIAGRQAAILDDLRK